MSNSIHDSLAEHLAVSLSIIPLEDDIRNVATIIIHALNDNHKVLVIGNGGSAADAQHFAAEFVGRFEMDREPLPVLALTTNSSELSAIANDYNGAMLFERQVMALGVVGDVLLAISTSGESENVRRAVGFANALGITTIGLLGKGESSISKLCKRSIHVPHTRTARIQEAHITILHCIAEYVEREMFE